MTFEERMLELLKTGDKASMRSELDKLTDTNDIHDAMDFAKLLTQHAPTLHEAAKEIIARRALRGNQGEIEL